MKRVFFLVIPVIFVTLIVACPGGNKHHKTAMPDPESYNMHFGDMDANGDELVNREEFNANFQDAEPKVFNALDLNQDGSIDHDEWHKFKEAHGLKHKE
jgi:hypothetical protein